MQLDAILNEAPPRGGLETFNSSPNYQRLLTVLIIEDERSLSHALEIRLRKSGFDVEAAFDGLSGLEKCRTLEPDLVLLDLCLPRMSGFKLLQTYQADTTIARVPVVIMTGNPDPDIARKVSKWGAERIFQKPVRQAKVVRAIEDILGA